jgi:hypothetical protein
MKIPQEPAQVDGAEQLQVLIEMFVRVEETIKSARERCSTWPYPRAGMWYRTALLLGAAADCLWIVEQGLIDVRDAR